MLPYIYFGNIQISLYSTINNFAVIAALFTNLAFLYQENLLLSCWCPCICATSSRKRFVAIRYTVYWTIFLSFLQIIITGQFNGLWAQITKTGFGNYFGNILFAPPVFALICLILKIHPFKQLDLFTPSYIVSVIFYKLACFFHGCCNGKPWKHGIYFVLNNRHEFPSQLLEAFSALVILIVILRLMKSGTNGGKIMPIYIILFSVTRFLTEFSREGDIILLGLQNYQLQCLLGIAIGSIELFLINRYGPSFDNWFAQYCANKKTHKS